MSAGFTFLGRTTEPDFRFDGNEGRTLFVGLGFFDCFADGVKVVAVFDGKRLKTERFHALLHIFRKGDVRTALDGYAIAVVEDY